MTRSSRVSSARLANADGSTIPLVLALSALCLAIVLVGVAATSLYLERKRLLTLADGAALAGAEAYDLASSSVDERGEVRPALEPDRVREAVDAHVALALSAGGGRHDELVASAATTTDGRSAVVRIAAVWRPPVLAALLPEGVPLEVESVARSILS